MNLKNNTHVKNLIVVAMCCFGISLTTVSAITDAVSADAKMAPAEAKTAATTVQSTAIPAFDEKLQTLSASVNGRLSAIEVSINRSDERAAEDRKLTRWVALATVVVSAFFSLAAQWLLMVHQRSLNREQAQAEVSNSYVEWQLKQLSKLYGPLRALLGQSNAMYRQMNRVLAAAEPNMFRLRTEEGVDFDNEVFEILVDGYWCRFRTVKHLVDVYNRGYGVEPYFDDVVKVGARIADLIRDKAGYAQPSDQQLIDVMGSYLAHYAVLSRLHQQAKDGGSPKPNKADEQATFPIAIQKLVNDGFTTLNMEVMDWKSNGQKSVKA
jgi:hypothetical protein